MAPPLQVPGSDDEWGSGDGPLLAPATCSGDDAGFRPVPQRWWMLFVVSTIGATQGGMWSNFGPISGAVEPLLGWGDGTIALLVNWGPICYLLAFLPFAWLLNERGLRPSALVAAALVAAGAAARCVDAQRGWVTTVTMHVGQLLNGLAGPFAMSAGPVLSAQWFPPHERTTATAVAAMLNGGGTAVMFIVGPALVPEPGSSSGSAGLTPAEARDLDGDLRRYMIGEAVFAAAVLAATAAYFPNRPPAQPSHTAGVPRTGTADGVRQLLRMREFWLCVASYSVVTGSVGAWAGMLGPNLKHVIEHNAEEVAGELGFAGVWASVLSGIGWSAAADLLQRRARGHARGLMKRLLLCLLAFGTAAFLLFALICEGALPQRRWALYLLICSGSFLLGGTSPLFYEMCVEAAYPVGEGVTTCVLTAGNNVACLLFLITPTIPGLGTRWMNWCVVAGAVGGAALLLPFPVRLQRLDTDLAHAADGAGGSAHPAEAGHHVNSPLSA